MRIIRTEKARRILDFDIENRPSTYWYGDATTAEITAIAWQFIGEDPSPTVVALGEPGMLHPADLLDAFLPKFAEADLVTGHYIRRHDLPIINAHCLEAGYPPLPSKMTQDTKLDLTKTAAMSMSQETLAALLGVEAPKVSMAQLDWRTANRLDFQGIELTRERVVGDIIQHVAMRAKLIERGLLKPPSMWHSVAGGVVYRED